MSSRKPQKKKEKNGEGGGPAGTLIDSGEEKGGRPVERSSPCFSRSKSMEGREGGGKRA